MQLAPTHTRVSLFDLVAQALTMIYAHTGPKLQGVPLVLLQIKVCFQKQVCADFDNQQPDRTKSTIKFFSYHLYSKFFEIFFLVEYSVTIFLGWVIFRRHKWLQPMLGELYFYLPKSFCSTNVYGEYTEGKNCLKSLFCQPCESHVYFHFLLPPLSHFRSPSQSRGERDRVNGRFLTQHCGRIRSVQVVSRISTLLTPWKISFCSYLTIFSGPVCLLLLKC